MTNLFQFLLNRFPEILAQTIQHLYLTMIALVLAIFFGVLIGIFLSRFTKISSFVLGILGVIQTIPSLALLGFMLPFLGIGAIPAIFALFLYALLPIVRNTFIGIQTVDKAVVESANGIGMSNFQILIRVELPLAIPIIFAGIRTATVINVGVATLCALIGAGGLGEFIFRGIALNNPEMILAGAIPAALLALFLDIFLGFIQKHIYLLIKPLLISLSILIAVIYTYQHFSSTTAPVFRAGFDAEFIERVDGFPGLCKHYGIKFPIKTLELDAGLMYQALVKDKVDMIGGYSTDGRIQAYGLKILEDDKAYFPPYFVVPLVNDKILEKHPSIRNILEKISNKISDKKMQNLNFQVDSLKKEPVEVARTFLKELGFKTDYQRKKEKIDLIIGGKKFTEQYILCEIFKILLENYNDLNVEIKNGLGGTQIVFEALRTGEIDIYPEYTGTAFLVLLKPDKILQEKIIRNKNQVYEYVKSELKANFKITMLKPLGFNNSYALMMTQKNVEKFGIKSISDLKNHLEKLK